MFRKAERKFQEWKNNPDKKALLVTGARQIGKTYLVRQFGKANYEKFVEINFLTQPSAAEIFKGDLNADTLIMNLTAFLGTSLKKGKTLIFLDEIQKCPNARTAIKFLVDDGRFDYIESGSLLGVNYKHVSSFPVGYEQTVQMYPMDFEEFCLANGVQPETIKYLNDCFDKREPVSEVVHNKMTDLFRYYVIVGGMPAVVQTFIDTHDIGRVVALQKDILAQYQQDISQYTQEKKTKVKNIFDQIPAQLDDKNRRFTVAAIDRKVRLREYEDAFLWLQDAGVALRDGNGKRPIRYFAREYGCQYRRRSGKYVCADTQNKRLCASLSEQKKHRRIGLCRSTRQQGRSRRNQVGQGLQKTRRFKQRLKD